jgi:hypothetical protein
MNIGEPTRAEYCAGKGPPVAIAPPQATAGSMCMTSVATRVFDHALCTCQNAAITGSFLVDGFNSNHAVDAAGHVTSASVGVNTDLAITGDVDIHGSLVNAGTRGIPITSSKYNIDGNFESNCNLVITGANVQFGRDVWVNGSITSTGSAHVAGSVYQPAGKTLLGSIGGTHVEQSFTVPEPCACAADQLLDIDAIVAAGTAANHNSSVGLSQGAALINVNGGDTLDLGCGRFAFSNIAVLGTATIKASGRTALFIHGNLAITGNFGLDVGATGEMDVFITGNLAITGQATIGSPKRPAAVRFYVGGSGDIAITGGTVFAANLYAPRSNLAVTGNAETYGSYFVRRFAATGSQIIHYDSAILEVPAAEGCKPPGDHCTRDLECGSTKVCIEGGCTFLSPD